MTHQITASTLLDPLEKLIGLFTDCDLAFWKIPPDIIARLRAAIRTPEETAALRVALEWLNSPFDIGAVAAIEAKMDEALEAIPEEVKARLRGDP